MPEPRRLTTIAALDRQAAIADERNRMARDLHDVVAGHLSAIAIQSEAALGITGAESDERLHRTLKSVRGNSIDALEEMRSMIGLLRTDIVDEAAAPGRLRQLAKLVDSAHAAGTEVAVHDDLAPGQLPTAVDHTAYRIAQEALTNAIKHAPGHPVELTLRSQIRAAGDDGLQSASAARTPVGSATPTHRAHEHARAHRTARWPVQCRTGPRRLAGRGVHPRRRIGGGRMIRVLVADDHAAIRSGLSMILGSADDIEVVGEAADGEVALGQARASAARRGADGHPDARHRRHRGDPGDRRGGPGPRAGADHLRHRRVRLRGAAGGASGFLLKIGDGRGADGGRPPVAAGDGVLAPQVTRPLIDAFAAARAEPARRPAGIGGPHRP